MQNGGTQILIDGGSAAILIALLALIIAVIALRRLGKVNRELEESKTKVGGPSISSIRDTATKAAEEVLRKAFGDQINVEMTPQAIEQLMPKLAPEIAAMMGDDEDLTRQLSEKLLGQLAAKDLSSFMSEGAMTALKTAIENQAESLAESALDDGDNWQTMVDFIAKWCVGWMEEQLKDPESEFYKTTTYCLISTTCREVFGLNYDDIEDVEEPEKKE